MLRLLSLLMLVVSLPLAAGCCNRCFGTREEAVRTDNTAGTERAGVTVTKEVPHSKETILEILDRDAAMPLPSAGDKAIHSHRIRRAGNDNCMRTE